MITKKKIKKKKALVFSDFENLLLNMTSGLLPEHLTRFDVKVLEDRLGKSWFEELGYTEPKYQKP